MRKKNLILVGVLCVCMLTALSSGRYPIRISEIIKGLFNGHLSPQVYTLFFQMRLPRMLLVALSGASLALAGLIYQNVFKNPLVSPDVLGVSSGCSVGAILAILFVGGSSNSTQLAAFLGGCTVVIITMSLAKAVPSERILALIVSGIVVSALASALIMFLKYLADPYKDLPTIEFWLMGGFYNASYAQLKSIMIPILIAILAIYLFRWQLNVLSLGEEQALSLGVNTTVVRIVGLIASTLMVAAVVSVAGVVSWVGLMAPHIVKKMYSEDLRQCIFGSLLVGATLLLVADTVARSLLSVELPISILTTLMGAPFLAYLMIRKGKKSL